MSEKLNEQHDIDDWIKSVESRERDIEKALYQKALSKFGLERQLRMVQEECAELIVAVSKVIREPGNVERVKDLIEEAADVQIMCGQLAMIYGKDRIDAMMLKKHDRLRKRLAALSGGKETAG